MFNLTHKQKVLKPKTWHLIKTPQHEHKFNKYVTVVKNLLTLCNINQISVKKSHFVFNEVKNVRAKCSNTII